MVGVGCREYRQSSEELFSESSDEVREPDVRLESDGTADIAGLLTWIIAVGDKIAVEDKDRIAVEVEDRI